MSSPHAGTLRLTVGSVLTRLHGLARWGVRYRRAIAAFGTLVALVVCCSAAGALPPAAPTDAPAPAAESPVATSRYVNWLALPDDESDATTFRLACSAARSDGSGVVVLAFGKQVDGGVTGFGPPGTMRSYVKVQRTVTAYAQGLASCSDSPWTLAVATSNFELYDLDRAAALGALWQQTVTAVANSATRPDRVTVVGSLDLEPGWGGSAAAKAWVDAYRTEGPVPLVANASADGCPQQGLEGVCANGWTVGDLAEMVWGGPGSAAVPQVYREDGAQARQWMVLARTWAARGGTPVFAAVMSQRRACRQVRDRNCPSLSIPPRVALDQLRTALGELAPVPAATDIGWG